MKQYEKPIRVCIAKAGLDGHERGALSVALGLKDEGICVIYTGLRATPEQVIQTIIKEQANVIGISSLTGSHNTFISKLLEVAKDEGLNMRKVLLIVGGIIPEKDVSPLKKMGVSKIFGPGTNIKDIADYIRRNVKLGE